MVVTWSTIDNPNSTFVEYGLENIGEMKTEGTLEMFVAPGELNLTQYIHRVTLEGLIPGEAYIYHCGSNFGWSELFFFRAMKNGTDWTPQLAVFGDLGNVNAKTLARLQRETQLNYYDSILHVGDFAYNLESENGQVGNAFMEQIQPIASYVPYMVCPGNHEEQYNFLHYKKRFSMPGKFENMAYSWNLGRIHFVAISTEFHYYLEYGHEILKEHHEWVIEDLKQANAPENRTVRPWVIVYGHKPMYCSNTHGGDCNTYQCAIRDGLYNETTGLNEYGLEDVFMQYGVDLFISAHEHSYERLWPLYNHVVLNGSFEEPYRNPKALTHIITGSAGCLYEHDPFPPHQPHWSAFRAVDYGYSRLMVPNATHLYLEQMSEDKDGEIIDSFWLIREYHEPYKFKKNSKIEF